MSTKMSTRPRKHKHKEEMKQETVAQVHKTIKSDTSSEEKNKTRSEDKNDNYSTNTPSREISVDEESQINSKILSLIESEMKRDANKHSHFTDSRPQSLSFYEDEKVPEELSGNLELLSPEERKHYKRRKEYGQMDTDEMNAYNVIQDLYSRDGDEIISSTKKSKSRKKRHADAEIGIGDSREMMIPREKKKSKKKKRESSPAAGKRKHKKRDEDYEPRNDVTVALEELQDDVFENNEEFNNKVEKVKKSPRKSDKIYVQKKNKFEAVTKPTNLNRQSAYDFEEDTTGKKFHTYHPLELAIPFQEYWMRLTTLCHGLLGGLAFGHWLYIISNIYVQDNEFISHYSHFSDIYVSFFYLLCVICLISVFEKYKSQHLRKSHFAMVDFAHFGGAQFRNLFQFRKSSLVILIYFTCLVVHLSAARIDYKLGLVSYDNETISNITKSELTQWNHLSLWRSILAFLAWIIVGLSPQDNMFYVNLKNMEKYLPQK
ncbi:transcriptional regulator ATRX -like [Asbolus verrucosus]|uniref:Transcriptional regulator ATRX-like n=1 Tax=Asbolus verrucosus TaxID=1661398 RepID=A0A482VT00_ASBVE|nr:transcriptional regulator ATRX -like [Asbolus verrucosus]